MSVSHYERIFKNPNRRIVNATKEMDIRRIKAEMEYLEAEEKRYIAKAQFG